MAAARPHVLRVSVSAFSRFLALHGQFGLYEKASRLDKRAIVTSDREKFSIHAQAVAWRAWAGSLPCPKAHRDVMRGECAEILVLDRRDW